MQLWHLVFPREISFLFSAANLIGCKRRVVEQLVNFHECQMLHRLMLFEIFGGERRVSLSALDVDFESRKNQLTVNERRHASRMTSIPAPSDRLTG